MLMMMMMTSLVLLAELKFISDSYNTPAWYAKIYSIDIQWKKKNTFSKHFLVKVKKVKKLANVDKNDVFFT